MECSKESHSCVLQITLQVRAGGAQDGGNDLNNAYIDAIAVEGWVSALSCPTLTPQGLRIV